MGETVTRRAHSAGGAPLARGPDGFIQWARERALVLTLALQVFLIALFGLADATLQDPQVRWIFYGALILGLGLVNGVGYFLLRPLIRGSDHLLQQAGEDKQDLQATMEERIEEIETYAHELEQANEDLRRFAHVASHDLKEPVRMVSSYVDLIDQRYGGQLDDEAQEYMTYAVEGAHRLHALIDGLLAYAQVGEADSRFEPVDLDHTLDDAVANLAHRIEASGATIHRGDLPRTHGDPRQLTQVFQNLLSNAIEFSEETVPEIHIWAEERDDAWEIAVRDHGVGFDSTREHRIFDIFQTAHGDRPGRGVGLAVCQRIIDRHHGRIWAEAKPGEGAIFRFTVPQFDPGAADGHPQPLEPLKTLQERTERVI